MGRKLSPLANMAQCEELTRLVTLCYSNRVGTISFQDCTFERTLRCLPIKRKHKSNAATTHAKLRKSFMYAMHTLMHASSNEWNYTISRDAALYMMLRWAIRPLPMSSRREALLCFCSATRFDGIQAQRTHGQPLLCIQSFSCRAKQNMWKKCFKSRRTLFSSFKNTGFTGRRRGTRIEEHERDGFEDTSAACATTELTDHFLKNGHTFHYFNTTTLAHGQR